MKTTRPGPPDSSTKTKMVSTSDAYQLIDDADEFEEALAKEMLRTGAIDVWL